MNQWKWNLKDSILLGIILSSHARRYECSYNRFDIKEPIDTIGLFLKVVTDRCFYASDTLKFLRTLTINEFFNYMINK